MSDITPLLPWVNEPYRKDEVLATARSLPEPFLLSEVVAACHLSRPVVHRVLLRAVKAGVLTRSKVKMSYPTVTGGQGHRPDRVRWIAGGRQRRVWAYRFVEGK